MPSPAHEILVAALADQPELLVVLVQRLLGRGLDARFAAADSTLRFSAPEEVRPDVVLREIGGARWVLVEVQNDVDEAKPRRWALAAAALFDQSGVMGDLVVITKSRRVARWATRAGRRTGGLGTRWSLRPVVVLLDDRAASLLVSSANPELAALAAWAMRGRRGPRARAIVEEAVALHLRGPASALRDARMRAIYWMLDARVRASFEEAMMGRLDDLKAPPEAYAFVRALNEREARAEARGETRGEARGEARALLAVIGARGWTLTDDQRHRVLSCTDSDLLEVWVGRAAVAAHLEDVLG